MRRTMLGSMSACCVHSMIPAPASRWHAKFQLHSLLPRPLERILWWAQTSDTLELSAAAEMPTTACCLREAASIIPTLERGDIILRGATCPCAQCVCFSVATFT